MGILNITPDSFSDGGVFTKRDNVLRYLDDASAHGVDIIDIGGESTRPGAAKVALQAELDRVLPIIELVKENSDIPVSIDTYKSAVANAALNCGAAMVNDISGGTFDNAMFGVVAKANVPYVLMHIKGTPKNMQQNPQYDDLLSEIATYFTQQIAAANAAGVEQIILDVGIGFGKSFADNFKLIRQLDYFKGLAKPLLIGASRKSFLAGSQKSPAAEREIATAVVHAEAILNGARIVRSHHLAYTRQMLDTAKQLLDN
jgi:dihydropteroate synthase